MNASQAAQRINQLSHQIQEHKAKHGGWVARKETCNGNLRNLHNQQINRNNIQAMQQHRHEQTMWRNRLNECNEHISNLVDLVNRKQAERKRLQQQLDARRR